MIKFLKLKFKKVYNHPLYFKVINWVKLISFTAIAQVTITGIGFVSGILIIRVLTPAEYALYTLASTMIGTMTLLADGGISAGVMSQGAKYWTDKENLGTVFSTGYNLRKKFAIGSLLIALPILIYLLHYHGASWVMAIIITLALIPAFITNLSNQLLVIIPKLNQDIYPLKKVEIGVNLVRLGLLVSTIFIFPFAFIAILAAGIPQIWGNRRFFKISSRYADLKQPTNPIIEKEIYSLVKKMMPGVIYYCLAGNLTIWIATFLGSTNVLAQLGALSRIAMVLMVSNVLFTTLITPRFAILMSNVRLLFKRYSQIQILLFGFSAFVILITSLFSNEILWVLGSEYDNLNIEIILVMIGACINFISASSFSLNTSRGWVINPLISIPIEIASIVIGVLLFHVSLIQGILMLNIFVAVVHAIMHISFSLIKISKVKLTPQEF